MASYTSTRFSGSTGHRLTEIPARSAVNEICEYGSFDVDVALVTNDTIDLFTLPKDAVLVDLKISAAGSLGGTADLDVGISTDSDLFISAGDLSSAGVLRLSNADGALYKATADVVVQVKADSIATGTTGEVLKFDATISFAELV